MTDETNTPLPTASPERRSHKRTRPLHPWLAQLRAEHQAIFTQTRAQAKAEAKEEHEASPRKSRVAYMRSYRRKKRAADPEYQRKKHNRNERKNARKRRKKLIHERWLKRMELARLKREAKAERRRIRQERFAQRMAQELTKKEANQKHNPWIKRLAEARIEYLQEGIRVGRAQVLAEMEAHRAAEEGYRYTKSSERT